MSLFQMIHHRGQTTTPRPGLEELMTALAAGAASRCRHLGRRRGLTRRARTPADAQYASNSTVPMENSRRSWRPLARIAGKPPSCLAAGGCLTCAALNQGPHPSAVILRPHEAARHRRNADCDLPTRWTSLAAGRDRRSASLTWESLSFGAVASIHGRCANILTLPTRNRTCSWQRDPRASLSLEEMNALCERPRQGVGRL